LSKSLYVAVGMLLATARRTTVFHYDRGLCLTVLLQLCVVCEVGDNDNVCGLCCAPRCWYLAAVCRLVRISDSFSTT